MATNAGMYYVYKQMHPPTGVELCTYCHFFNNTEKNLVIVAVNQLSVYRLNPDTETKLGGTGVDKSGAEAAARRKHKLECLLSFELSGHVECVEPVSLPGAARDALLISFQQAKLSMVEYDPTTHDLRTLSLHYFEDDSSLRDGQCQTLPYRPILRVDPEARCAAMLTYGSKLVILPFRRDIPATPATSVTDMDPDGPGAASQAALNKTPFLSSYIIDLRRLDEKITGVIDLHFLHGYYEPTLLILHEPLPTWSGRLAVRKDSCSIVAISLNLQEKVHPIIWSQQNLPHDCCQAVPVPKPTGGVLVFAANSLIYLNQSFPPYGVSLNSLVDSSTEFLLKRQPGVRISLDCAHAAFLADDRLVLSLRGGELYVLTLVTDTMRAVRGFHLDKAAASVLTAGICACEPGYLFLASRLGNSLLLKYTEKNSDVTVAVELSNGAAKRDKDEPAVKRQKKDNLSDWMASDISTLDDLDDLEVYGDQPKAMVGSTIVQYSFEVCDSVMNIGPCGQCVMGEPAFISEEFTTDVDPDLELVTTSGYGKNGAISVLQRSIRPQVVTTFELPGCLDMWTVYADTDDATDDDPTKSTTDASAVEGDSAGGVNDPLKSAHAFLIMSREDSSMVLKTGREIMELDQSGFGTTAPTLFACNLGNNKYILQVAPNSVRLLHGATQLQFIPVDFGCPIVWVSAADPYVAVLSARGQVMLLTLKPDPHGGKGVRLACSRPPATALSKVSGRLITINLYCDVSGLFSVAGDSTADEESAKTEAAEVKHDDVVDATAPPASTPATPAPMESSSRSLLDDEDELLYGDSDISSLFAATATTPVGNKAAEAAKSPAASAAPLPAAPAPITPTFWAVTARDSGLLEIWALPDFRSVFAVRSFPLGHRVLVPSGASRGATADAKQQGESSSGEELPVVKELLLVGLGNRKSRPHLFARVAEELLLYEAFPQGATSPGSLKLRFKKIPHGLIIKAPTGFGAPPGEGDKSAAADRQACWLRPFDDISGYAGVFVAGPYPHWVLMTARGALRFHPMSIDGAVDCFTAFHNVNCPRGFLYFNKGSELRICVLPTHLAYDAPWPVRKVPLRCTPYFVCYHLDSKTYSIVTSVAESCSKFVKVVGDGEKEFETCERDERFILPTLERFSIQLFSPVSWEPIPNTKIAFEEFEHVTCIKCVSLKSEGTLSGLKQYMAVSTSYCYNEDVTSRGRLIIYDVIEVVPEPGQPLTKNKIKIEYDKEQKGPVTAIEHVSGYLVTAIGQKIYIWVLSEGDLSGVAFIDTSVFIHQLATVKNLILVGDMLKSITLLRFQPELKVLSLVSRDFRPMEVYNIGFTVDETRLGFLVTDRLKNLVVFSYQPEVREAVGGARLLPKADINIDHHVTSSWRVRCKLTEPSGRRGDGEPTLADTAVRRAGKHVTYCATLDGSLAYLLPLHEKTFRRLQMLQNNLVGMLPHTAGLNPRAYRSFQAEYRSLANPQRNILDGQLLWRFLHLSVQERAEVTKRTGMDANVIVDDLMEIDRCAAHY